MISTGPAMAFSDACRVTVRGRGGHGSRPEDTIDPVRLACHMVVRLQSVVSREVPPQESVVVTVATFHAGLKENVIPATAEFTINVRNLNADAREEVLAGLRRVILAEAPASGARQPQIEERHQFPLLINDPETTDRGKAALGAAIGPDNILGHPAQMSSEDFGALPDPIGVPGVYWFSGGMPDEVIDGDEPVPSNHSPLLAPIIEPTLTTGVTAAYTAIMSRVGSGNGRDTGGA
ncbi:MAG: peptidase dimerization domain-containing protein [Ornithinimicrobium sp.]|uniref:peptidase dimerization domain-containing protein n=1 Tax=Ornithinimicrobium sp. TaxID=1977084 RepID=UPI003D9B2001